MAQSRLSSKDDKTKFQMSCESEGLSGTLVTLQDKMQDWKSTPINIAVTGSSRTGKSYFINAIRNVKPGSAEAARTGTIEISNVIPKYPHPTNSLICFYEIPGCGTMSFPRATYVNDVKFETYDFFIIMSTCRFTEDDLWLANEVEKKKKRFYFCRSKVDLDVEAAVDDYPGQSVDDVLKTIRNDCSDRLKGFPTTKLFLISSKYETKYDFSRLSKQLLQDFPEIQAEALAFSMSALTERSIEIKTKALEKHISQVAENVALKGALTYRLTDVNAIKEAALYYLQQLALDSDSLEEVCRTYDIDRTSLAEELQSTSMDFSDKGIESIIDKFAPVSLLGKIVRLIPLIGKLSSRPESNQMAKVVLQKVLDLFIIDANIVRKHVITKMTTVKNDC